MFPVRLASWQEAKDKYLQDMRLYVAMLASMQSQPFPQPNAQHAPSAPPMPLPAQVRPHAALVAL